MPLHLAVQGLHHEASGRGGFRVLTSRAAPVDDSAKVMLAVGPPNGRVDDLRARVNDDLNRAWTPGESAAEARGT